ncbi:MAG: TonB-dependent receptor [Prevotellaceae bacterium]|nr:TonB-dependent receptor [Prevotellaceae bacterium]
MEKMVLTGSLREEGNLTVHVPRAKVEVKGKDLVTHADGTGYFVIDGRDLRITSQSPELVLVISAEGYETQELVCGLDRIDLGVIFMKVNFKDVNPITVNDLMPDRPESEGISLSATGAAALFWNNDPLAKSTNYTLGMHGYKMRGYDWRHTEVYLDGASFNDPETGYAFAGHLNGFIDVTKRNSGSSRVLNHKIYYGDIGGYSNISFNPLYLSRRGKVAYSFGNSLYTHSFDLAYATGTMPSGWAFALQFSRKYGPGFIKGTDYDGFSYLLSAGAEIDEYNSFSFFVGGSPTTRGSMNYSAQKTYVKNNDHYFNPLYGLYDGRGKNVKTNSFHQPVLGMSHEWEGEIAFLKTSLLLSTGFKNETGMKSSLVDSPDKIENPFFASSPVLWDSIRALNESSLDRRSLYILDRNSCDRTMVSLNSVYDLLDWGNLETTAGIEMKLFFGRYYNRVDNLLGGDYWLNIDKFKTSPPDTSFYQFDMQAPNRKVKADGSLGHDYSVFHRSYKFWNVWRYYAGRFKFSLGASTSYIAFGYTGNVRNGKVETSGSKTPDLKFFNFSGKGGIAFKLTPNSDLEANAMYAHQAPLFSNAYPAPRISGEASPAVTNEKILAAEANFTVAGKRLSLRVSGYFTMIKDRMESRSYFSDDYASMLNMGLSGVGTQHFGGELCARFNLFKSFKVDLAAAYGIYKYNSNPQLSLHQENLNEQLYAESTESNMTGLFVGNVPQLAVSADILYDSPLNFWAGVNASVTAMSHSDFSPVALVWGSAAANEQIVLPVAFTLNFKGGYAFTFGGRSKKAFVLSANIQNLLDNKNGILGAYRLFGAKNNELHYAYMYGRSYYLTLSFKI